MKRVFYLGLFACTFALAEERECLCPCEEILPGYNAPLQIECQTDYGCLFTASMSFIYWQAIEENMELGIVGDTSLSVINGSVVNMDFDYEPGLQIGVGVLFPPDCWDGFVEYTWFRTNSYRQRMFDVENFTLSLFPTWQAPDVANSSYFFGSERWKLHMDIIDAQLGRAYYVGRCLTFHPFIGLRAPWIRQWVLVNYEQEINDPLRNTQIRQLSHSWGIGPRMGLTMDWLFCYGLRIYAKGGMDAAFTQYTRLKYEQQAIVNGQIEIASRRIIEQRDVNTLRPHLDLTLGLGWECCLPCNCGYLDLMLDYGFQVFFNQNMFRTFVDDQSLAKSISPNGDLFIQGLTIRVCWDF